MLSLKIVKTLRLSVFILLLTNLNDVISSVYDSNCVYSQNKIMEYTNHLVCSAVPTNGVPATLRSLQVNGEVNKLTKDMFENLAQIRYLDLSQCNISQMGSMSFSSMVELNILRLSQNNIDFVLDDVFGNLKHLQELHLDKNGIKVILDGAFKSLPSLRQLNLDDNKLLEIPAELPQTLRKLTLRNNDIERLSMEKLSNLIQLDVLNLCGNEINMWPPGDFLPNLRTLCLGDRIEKSATASTNLRKLEQLQLSGRKLNSGKISSSLKNKISSLSNLKKFQLENYEVTSFEFLESTKNLEYVKLENISYHLNGLKWFPKNLTTLSINWSPLMAHQLLNSTLSMPKLKILSLKGNNITAIDKIQCKYLLKSITSLDISDNPLDCIPEKWNWLQQKIRDNRSFLNDSNNVVCSEPKEAKNKNLLDVLKLMSIEKPYEMKTVYVTSNFTVSETEKTLKTKVVYGFLIFLTILTIFFFIMRLCHWFVGSKYKNSCIGMNEQMNNSSTPDYMPKDISSTRSASFKMKLTNSSTSHPVNVFLQEEQRKQIECDC